jgi:hypothetical protein
MEYLHLNVPEWKEYMDIEKSVPSHPSSLSFQSARLHIC